MTWQQLKDIVDENRKEAEESQGRSITECPECCFAGLRENQDKVLLCPICGWRGGR